LLAGPDSEGYSSQVRDWLKQENVLEKATFAGMLVGERKSVALTESTMFVLPSYSENFGIAVVEAMASGLPVVISNRVNIWREVHRAGAGIIVDPSAHATANAIKVLLNDPVRARVMGACGRNLARERFAWDAAGAKLVELYRQIISSKAASITSNERRH
jgi:glycosyltransferase involved in cell wall biosynthesis